MLVKYLPLAGLLALAGCGQADAPATDTGIADVRVEADADSATLPYLGAAGRQAVPAFSLPDQDGRLVSSQSLAGKVYVTDFFFATCPGICPKMQSEVLKVYKQFGTNPQVAFLSFSIDPAHDSAAVLRDYARRLGVGTPGSNWRFLRPASRPAAYALAHPYLAAAETDPNAPGGIAHTGALALVDDRGFVRGTYDGLNPAETDRLLRQLPLLLAEVKARQSGQ